MNLIEKNKEKIFNLCNKYNVRELYLFGSILSERFNDSSDIDMLIQFSPINISDYFDNYMDFKESLEELLDRKIDLVENQSIRNPVFRNILDREKRLIYERKSA